jgi:hypothetical protein
MIVDKQIGAYDNNSLFENQFHSMKQTGVALSCGKTQDDVQPTYAGTNRRP